MSYSPNIFKILFSVIAIITFFLIFRNDQSLVGRPLTEDGYYSLTVARNIAIGNGFTVGEKMKTNGFQPLFTILSTSAYFLTSGNKFDSLRLILFIEWIIYLSTALLLGRIAKYALYNSMVSSEFKNRVSQIVPLLYIASVSVFLLHFNGLETGFLLFCYALLWHLHQIDFNRNYKGLIIYSMLLGLLVLVRIDAIIFVILYAFFEMIQKRDVLRLNIKRFLIISAVSFLITLPWWLYNYINFGSFIPTSGLAQQNWIFSFLRIKESLIALSQTLVPMVYLGTATYEGILSNILRLFLIILLLIFINRIYKKEYKILLNTDAFQRTFRFGMLLIGSIIILVTWYTASFFATWFYFRYFSPFILVSVLSISFLVSYIIGKRPKYAYSTIILIFPVLISVILISKDRYPNEYYIHQLALINEYVPENELVGAYQSGTLGYFREKTINLDGKTNLESLMYRDSLMTYINKKNIKWLCDWRWKVRNLIESSPITQKQKWREIGQKGNFLLLYSD